MKLSDAWFRCSIIACGLTWLLTCGEDALGEPNGFRTLEIGDPVPEFRLPGIDDRTYTLADFRDAKVLLVVFTCNHCPTAQAYE